MEQYWHILEGLLH